ncbi:MAG: homoserine dehydrogenase [Neomegalonema sp.]|nr:homoserine dehydrogenase [Neomegalonema sp.]
MRIGIAGLGTVGAGVVKIMQRHSDLLAHRAGRRLELVAVAARSRTRDRGVDLSAYDWEDDPVALAKREDIDLYIEVIGGSDGPAKASTTAALKRGAHVVTANKAMLALHGAMLAQLAEEHGASLRFEAGVAGGIPIIKALGDGLAANEVTRVFGVLNGTCNYILTKMARTGRDYSDILEEAKDLGYAEADPTADVGGVDAAHKLALLASLAFGTKTNFDAIAIEGIERITLPDIQFAADLGYQVKLIGSARMTPSGLEQRVAPCLIPNHSAIAALDGVTNAVVCEGDFVGQVVATGPGAGEGPTASAIVADIIDIARGGNRPVFGVPTSTLVDASPLDPGAARAPFFLRMTLNDAPGALAQVTRILGDAGVSIDQMRQHGRAPEPAAVLIVTHEALRSNVQSAVEAIAALPISHDHPVVLQIDKG